MEQDFERPIDLNAFDEEFSAAETVESKTYDKIPDGKYQVRVAKVSLETAQTTGTPVLKWQLRILAGKHAGRMIFKSNFITAKTLRYLKTDLVTCGLELGKLSELQENLGCLLDVNLEVFVKNGAKYANVYVNKRLELDDLSEVAQTAAASQSLGNDDIPF